MAQISRNVKTYNGQASFTAGIPTVADWNADFDTIVNGANAHDIATTAVHAVGAGDVVGTTLTQTLTNKTLTTPTLTTPTLTTPVLSGTATGSGTLGGSIVVPLARMLVVAMSASGSIVPTVAGVTMLTLPSMTVTAGDRVDVHWAFNGTAGATTTALAARLFQSAGTATAWWTAASGVLMTTPRVLHLMNTNASEVVGNTGVAHLYISVGGTLTLAMTGQAYTADFASLSSYLSAVALQGT